MTKRNLIFAALAAMALGAGANSQTTAGGSLALSGEVQGSIAILFWQAPAGYQLTEGTDSTAMAIGDVSAYGTPDGAMANKFTKAMDSDGFHVSSPFRMEVRQANLPTSSGYTLRAQLGDDDDTVWEVDGQVLSTTPVLLASAEPYAVKRQHILYAKFLFTKTATSLNDTITFTASAE